MTVETEETSLDKMKKVMGFDELVETAVGILSTSPNHAVLTRLDTTITHYLEKPAEGVELYRGVYIDTETTGLDCREDKMIEIALVPFDDDIDGNIYTIYPGYNGLEDPGIPIPEEITNITHITDEDVAGQSFDEARIAEIIAESRIVVAHNAGFDRGFCEERFPLFVDENWACSLNEIDWSAEGIESGKLSFIAFKKGFFFEGHRADVDCRAGIHALTMTHSNGKPYLSVMLDSARKPTYKLWAINAPFAKKDDLKKRKYRWNDGENGNPKAWSIEVTEDQYELEKAWLNTEVYGYNNLKVRVDKITAGSRYSQRILTEDQAPARKPRQSVKA